MDYEEIILQQFLDKDAPKPATLQIADAATDIEEVKKKTVSFHSTILSPYATSIW